MANHRSLAIALVVLAITVCSTSTGPDAAASAAVFLAKARARVAKRSIVRSLASERARSAAVLAYLDAGLAAGVAEAAAGAVVGALATRQHAVAARWTRLGRHGEATQLLKLSCELDPFSLRCWDALCRSAIRSAHYRLAVIACGDAAALGDSAAPRRRFDAYGAAPPLVAVGSGGVPRSAGALADALLRQINASSAAFASASAAAASSSSSSSWSEVSDSRHRAARQFATYVYGTVRGSAAAAEERTQLAELHRDMALEAYEDGDVVGALDHSAYTVQLGDFCSGFATWPYYCAVLERPLDNASRWRQSGHVTTRHLPPLPAALLTWDAILVVDILRDMFAAERAFLEDEAQTPPALRAVVRALRRLECSAEFVRATLEGIDASSDASRRRDASGVAMSISNFSFGTFCLHAFARLLRDPRVARAVARIRRGGGDEAFFVLGSNTGNEAFYIALLERVRVVGVEIQCELVARAEALRVAHAPRSPLAFRCADALSVDVRHAGAVYVDNDAWDDELTRCVWEKLACELPRGALVIAWHPVAAALGGSIAAAALQPLGTVKVTSTWSPPTAPRSVFLYAVRHRSDAVRAFEQCDVAGCIARGRGTE